MNRQVALIRGINVGRAKRVAMADLRALVADLGYSDVRTLLNSGNVVYGVPNGAGDAAATRIQDGIAGRLGVSARVVVVTAAELATVVAENPFRGIADDPARLLVAFLANPADLSRLEPLSRQDWAPEALAVGRCAAYLWCANGILESKLPAADGRLVGETATTRNWTTVTKLHAMVAGPS
jgi:uncharacterized protein (DUF1697 family)